MKKNIYFKAISILLVSLLLVTNLTFVSISATNPNVFDHALSFAVQQLNRTVSETQASKYPRSTKNNGTWNFVGSSDWTSGFYPGLLWYMYENTNDSTWRTRAESWTTGLETQKNNTGTHDLGFMLFNSFGNGYRLTQNESYKNVVLTAAQSLSTRYNPTVGCIKSWDGTSWKYPVIIDNMMNLELLFWASQNGGQQSFYNIALNHALKTAQNNVRTDGSTFHVVDYNPSTGAVLSKTTAQGYSASSTWSRGQAWALYGFTMSYRYTFNTTLLDTAKKVANYFVDNLPADYIPYWDFNAPKIPNEKRDTSAAAIAANGLLELSTYMSDTTLKAKYRNAAIHILDSLCSSVYLAEGSNSHGILLHGTASYPDNSEVDVSLIYGDYYFLEALLRVKRMNIMPDGSYAPTPVYTELPEPGNKITVSSLSELQNAINTAPPEGRVITLAAGTYDQTTGINITGKNNIILQGATSDYNDTVIKGPGINDPSLWINIKVNGSDHVTIRNMTIRDSYYHAIQVNEGSWYFHAVNLKTWDNGEAGFKVTNSNYRPGLRYSDYGIIENCCIGFTTKGMRSVIEGIDIIAAKGWIIRGNTFENVRGNETAVAFFAKANSQDSVVENNYCKNCFIALSFGGGGSGPNSIFRDGDYTFEHRNGIIRNNIIMSGNGDDTGIYMNKACNAKVYNNSVWNPSFESSIEFRFLPSINNDCRNNLCTGSVKLRDGGFADTGSNIINADVSMFVNAAAGDFHPASGASAVIDKGTALPDVPTDYEGNTRPQGLGYDIGAYEYKAAPDIAHDFKVESIVFTDSSDRVITELSGNGSAKATAVITNISGSSKKATLIAALYDGSKAIKNISFSEKLINPGVSDTITAGFDLPSDTTGYYIKVFVWDSLEGMKPLSDMVTLQ